MIFFAYPKDFQGFRMPAYTERIRKRCKIATYAVLCVLLLGLSSALYIYMFKIDILWAAMDLRNEPSRSDIIFVPSGGLCTRFGRAAELYLEGYSNEIVVILEKVPRSVNQCIEKYSLPDQKATLFQMTEVERIPLGAVKFMEESTSSYYDCSLLAEYFEKRNFSSVLVVTDPLHAPRMALTLRKVFGEINIVSCPTQPKGAVKKFYRNDKVYLLSEYLKYLFYKISYI